MSTDPMAPVVGVPEAASLAGVHPHTVRKAFRDGHLTGWTISGILMIDRASLVRWQPRSAGRPATGARSRKLPPGVPLLPADEPRDEYEPTIDNLVRIARENMCSDPLCESLRLRGAMKVLDGKALHGGPHSAVAVALAAALEPNENPDPALQAGQRSPRNTVDLARLTPAEREDFWRQRSPRNDEPEPAHKHHWIDSPSNEEDWWCVTCGLTESGSSKPPEPAG